MQPTIAQTTAVNLFFCPSRRAPPMLSTQYEVSSTGIPDSQVHPGSLGDYACNGGQFNCGAHRWTTRPATGSCAWSTGRVGQQPSVASPSTDITDGTSNTFLVGEKHAPMSMWGQGGTSYGDGSIYNGEFPRNFARIAGRRASTLAKGRRT